MMGCWSMIFFEAWCFKKRPHRLAINQETIKRQTQCRNSKWVANSKKQVALRFVTFYSHFYLPTRLKHRFLAVILAVEHRFRDSVTKEETIIRLLLVRLTTLFLRSLSSSLSHGFSKLNCCWRKKDYLRCSHWYVCVLLLVFWIEKSLGAECLLHSWLIPKKNHGCRCVIFFIAN